MQLLTVEMMDAIWLPWLLGVHLVVLLGYMDLSLLSSSRQEKKN